MELRVMSTNTNNNKPGIMDVLENDMKNPLFRLNIRLMKACFWGGVIIIGGLGVLINIIT